MYSCTLSLTSALDVSGWSTPRPGRFTLGKEPVPIVQEAGWVPGPVWTGAENLPPPLGFDPRLNQAVNLERGRFERAKCYLRAMLPVVARKVCSEQACITAALRAAHGSATCLAIS